MDPVTRDLTLPTTPRDTWALLTSPAELEAWLAPEVDLDPSPGAPGSTVDHDGTRRRLVVDEVEAGRRLSWRWWIDGDEGTSSRVDITLAPHGAGTLVTVRELPVPGAQASTLATGAPRSWAGRLVDLELLALLGVVVAA